MKDELISDCCGSSMVPPENDKELKKKGSLYHVYACYVCKACIKPCEPVKSESKTE